MSDTKIERQIEQKEVLDNKINKELKNKPKGIKNKNNTTFKVKNNPNKTYVTYRNGNNKTKVEKEAPWYEHMLSAASNLLPHVLPMLLGMGDYTEINQIPKEDVPVSNSLVAAATGGKLSASVPYVHRTGLRTRTSHREYLGDVYSSTSHFLIKTFPMNPAMQEFLPWFSTQANAYECYRILGMCVEIVSEGSEYSSTAGLGYYALATQYNSLAPSFVDKRSMLNHEGAVSCKPSKNLLHCIECKPGNLPSTELYTRSGPAPTGSDLRLYDWGKLSLAVGGNTVDGVVIGELWVSYDIETYIPRSTASISSDAEYAYFTSTVGITNAAPLGTSWTGSSSNTLDLNFSSTTIIFPNGSRGRYEILISWVGNSTAITYPLYTINAPNSYFVSFPSVQTSPPNASTTTTCESHRMILAVQDGCVVTVGVAGTLPASATLCQIEVWKQPIYTEHEDCFIFDRLGKNNKIRYMDLLNRTNQNKFMQNPTNVVKFQTSRYCGYTKVLDDSNFFLFNLITKKEISVVKNFLGYLMKNLENQPELDAYCEAIEVNYSSIYVQDISKC